MTPAYAVILGLYAYLTDIRAQKLDKSTFLIYDIVLVNF